MRQPDIWSVGAVKHYGVSRQVERNGLVGWEPARPEPHNAFSWRWRFKLAWKVLIGEYDALRWEGNNE